jgi:hypothetical protein
MKSSNQTPEEVELQQKEALLQQRQELLTEKELVLSTLQADLHSFEIEYYLKVGEKYVHIDRLQATLDSLLASKTPKDVNAKMRATESSKKAQQSENDAEQYKQLNETRQNKFEATPELKSLYRELAKLLHPDLTLDPEEKQRRHKLMQQINEAYQAGNLKKLTDILEAEKNNPENIKGDDIGSALVRAIRKIAQVEKRISELENEIEQLRKTDLFVLFEVIEREATKGINKLETMAAELDSRISFLQTQIEKANK